MTTTFIGACADHRQAKINEEDPMSKLTGTYLHVTV
jgi:hypothetical protein